MSTVIASGIDVGTSAVKVAFASVENGTERIIGVAQGRIRRRDPRAVIAEVYAAGLASAKLREADIDYVASTGEGELVAFRNAHFYGMTTHARGGLFLVPEARAVVDLGALHARAIKMDEHARVLSGRMTSQCASGSGQFLENIARYLGVALDEVGELSRAATSSEKISGICAVLAETDVINMVSRGIKTPDILRGIHESMAGRFVKLLRSSEAHGVVAVTGGLAADTGLVAAMKDAIGKSDVELLPVSHPWSVYAGAIGAALWGAFRRQKLLARGGHGTSPPMVEIAGHV
jgi:benzoyl-CoA reductase subunit D